MPWIVWVNQPEVVEPRIAGTNNDPADSMNTMKLNCHNHYTKLFRINNAAKLRKHIRASHTHICCTLATALRTSWLTIVRLNADARDGKLCASSLSVLSG